MEESITVLFTLEKGFISNEAGGTGKLYWFGSNSPPKSRIGSGE